MFALVDANNMYVSCERVFQPRLQGKPVVVLSSNDGACIARSNEAKDLGIKMAQPWFQVRHLERSAGLIAVSANFELYADMSSRMMSVASRFAPEQEIYSIDESFLGCAGLGKDLEQMGRRLRATVLRETGLPTSVGFGPTKTLAKLANHIGKSADRKPGSFPAKVAQVCDLGKLSDSEREAVFKACDVGDVWGVGRKLAPKLRAHGIHSAWDLSKANPALVRRQFSVVLEKTVLELQGVSCLDLTDVGSEPKASQQILVSRSFGRPISSLEGIVEAVSEFTARAAEKLRHQSSEASTLCVFFRTSAFRQNDAQHEACVTLPLGKATSDTRVLLRAAAAAVEENFRPGYRYAKAGALLLNLAPAGTSEAQLELFPGKAPPSPSAAPAQEERDAPQTAGGKNREQLMATLDALNRKFGRDAVHMGSTSVASQGAEIKLWATKLERRTPRYTTRWDELPVAKA